MSGIYIRGAEMPIDIEPGLVIEFADGIDGKRYARLYHYRHGGLTEWLEAVSVPPHGDLIDRDALMDDIIGSMVFSGREVPKEAAIVQKVLDIVGDANAIIPAEEGE